MNTVTSASNVTINGTADNDMIFSSGDRVTISAQAGDDYVISRSNSGAVYGNAGNDTLILLPASATSSTSGGRGNNASGVTEVHGNAGDDEIIVVHDSAVVYGDAGDDYMTVKIYESDGDFLTSLTHVTLTGGDGRDTFSFNTSLPSVLESVASVDGYRVEAIITDFSTTGHLGYTSDTDYFVYSILTDSQGNYTDLVLTGNSDRLRITLQGVTNVDDIVYARAVKFVDDSLESSYLGEVISNYTEDMSVLPSGIVYSNYTVYVSDQYTRNVWLMGTDEFRHTSTYRNISARMLDARGSTRKRVLVGNIRDNAIYAGSGGDTLWGGYSTSDTLFGGNGRDMFWYGLGDGSDCIRNYTAGSSATSDVVNFYNGGLSEAYRDNNVLHILTINGEELIIPLDYDVDADLQFSTDATSISRAKIGERFTPSTLTYDAAVNIFAGGSSESTLKVTDDRANFIWLDGSYGQNYYDFSVIDASESTGVNQIVGSGYTMKILGGEGHSTLWGGSGRYCNDTLIGGKGDEVFLFGKYEGSDVIVGAASDDSISLYNITLDDVDSIETVTGGIHVTFQNNDYSLTVQNSTGTPLYVLGDRTKWTYDKNTWTLVD